MHRDFSALLRRLVLPLFIAMLLVLGFTLPGRPGTSPPAAGGDQPAPPPATPRTFDLVFRAATVIDGSGRKAFRADVAVDGDTIAAVGNLVGDTGRREIDARELVVAPGFINTHSHTYEVIFTIPDAPSALRQGITTEIGGMDGRAPVDLAGHFARVEAVGIGTNYALLAGQGSIRQTVMGSLTRPATEEELKRMKALLVRAMEEGAYGLSTGLEYIPGRYTPTEEIIELARAAAPFGGIYASHIRDEGDRLLEAVQEALHIGRAAGLAVDISHFKAEYERNWPSAAAALNLMEEASQGPEAMKVAFDVYPYLSPDYAANMALSEVYAGHNPERITIRAARDAGLVGKTLAGVASAMGMAPAAAAEALLAGDPGIRVSLDVMSEDNLIAALQSPLAMICDDASARPQPGDEATPERVHPRAFGSFPRILGRYVREKGALTLEEAIARMTGRPAEFFGLSRRGFVREGYYADLVAFDPRTIADRATFARPMEYPEGIAFVLINGKVAVENGELVTVAAPDGSPRGIRAGRILRRGE